MENNMLKHYTFKKLSSIQKARELYEEGKEVYIQPFKTEDTRTVPYFKIKGSFENSLQTYKTYCTNDITGNTLRFYSLERI